MDKNPAKNVTLLIFHNWSRKITSQLIGVRILLLCNHCNGVKKLIISIEMFELE